MSIEWKFKNDSGFDFLGNESVYVLEWKTKKKETPHLLLSRKEKESDY